MHRIIVAFVLLTIVFVSVTADLCEYKDLTVALTDRKPSAWLLRSEENRKQISIGELYIHISKIPIEDESFESDRDNYNKILNTKSENVRPRIVYLRTKGKINWERILDEGSQTFCDEIYNFKANISVILLNLQHSEESQGCTARSSCDLWNLCAGDKTRNAVSGLSVPECEIGGSEFDKGLPVDGVMTTGVPRKCTDKTEDDHLCTEGYHFTYRIAYVQWNETEKAFQSPVPMACNGNLFFLSHNAFTILLVSLFFSWFYLFL